MIKERILWRCRKLLFFFLRLSTFVYVVVARWTLSLYFLYIRLCLCKMRYRNKTFTDTVLYLQYPMCECVYTKGFVVQRPLEPLYERDEKISCWKEFFSLRGHESEDIRDASSINKHSVFRTPRKGNKIACKYKRGAERANRMHENTLFTLEVVGLIPLPYSIISRFWVISNDVRPDRWKHPGERFCTPCREHENRERCRRCATVVLVGDLWWWNFLTNSKSFLLTSLRCPSVWIIFVWVYRKEKFNWQSAASLQNSYRFLSPLKIRYGVCRSAE